MTCNEVRELIEQKIPGSSAEVSDMTGTSDHFDVKVTSSVFEGKSLLDQHQIVHAALSDHFGDGKPIHAVRIKTTAA